MFAYATHLQINATFLADEPAYNTSISQVKVHLQLLGPVLDDQTLDGLLLGLAEHPAIAFGADSSSWTNGRPAANYKEINRAANAEVAQPCHCRNSHDFDALFTQPHDLLAPLMELIECLFGCVFFFRQT